MAPTKSGARVAVTSRSFSKHPVLRAELEALYERVTFNVEGKSLSGPELVKFLKGHERAITGIETIDEAVLSGLPELKVIGKFGVGVDMIDFHALRRHGVRFGWQGGTNKRSVSELVLGLMLSLLRNLMTLNSEVRRGTFRQKKGACLSGRTVGLVGCGHIGRDLVALLKPFGCRILVHDTRPLGAFAKKTKVSEVGLETLLRESDIVSLHLPVNDLTRGILNRERLALMKPGALLVNAARGGLVDEAALKDSLVSGRLAGAAFDVFAMEPPKDQQLLTLPNFLATPHIGGSTEEAILAMGRAAIAGLDKARPASAFLK